MKTMLATQGCGKEFFPVEVTLYMFNIEVEIHILTIVHFIAVVITSVQEPWMLYAVVKFHV